MTLILSGTDGLSDIDGSAATPAVRGTDANTGIFFGADIIGFAEGGAEVARFDSSGNLLVGTTSAATPSTTGYISVANTFGFKNRLINGAMVIDQRNAGASVTPTTDLTYTLDRFNVRLSVTSKFSVQQNAGAVTPPAGFTNYLGVTSLSAYSISASDYFGIAQRVEGFNVSDLNWGTASAQSVTLSFWVRSSLTGTFGVTFVNSASSRAYPATYTISTANTWEQKSITVAGDTSGTWVTNNGVGVQITWGLGYGTSNSTTANAWNAGTGFMATGATSVVGTNGATFYITGVQLEKGSTATSFDYRPYGTELQLAQRYFEKSYAQGTVAGATGLANAALATGISPNDVTVTAIYKVTKRASPTVTLYASGSGTSGALYNYSTGADVTSVLTEGGDSLFRVYKTSGITSGNLYGYQYYSSAEL